MIDSSDGDTFWLISLFGKGPFAILALIIAIVLWGIAMANEAECKQSVCLVGMAKLLDHACVCVESPLENKPKRVAWPSGLIVTPGLIPDGGIFGAEP